VRKSTISGGGETVWLKIDRRIEIGRPVNSSDLPLYAGQMVIFDPTDVTKAVQVVKATDTDNLAKVNGLVENDVFVGNITEDVNATCSIVTSGKVRFNLVDGGIPAEAQAVLPNIEFVPC
jgi:hypothetical protein